MAGWVADVTRLEQLGVGAVAIALAFAAGRYSTPERVVERVVEAKVERNEETTGVRTSESEGVSTAVVRTIETRPDGTRIETERHEEARVELREVEVVRVETVEKIVYRDLERIEERAPAQWRVGAELGIANAPRRIDIPGVPGYAPLVAGVTLERRVLGPVWVGGFVSTTPAVGARVLVEF